MSDVALPVIFRFDTTANRLAFTPSPGIPEQLYLWADSDNQPNAYYWDGANWQSFNSGGTGTVTHTGTLTSNALIAGNGSADIKAITTGTGILTALGINVGSAGAPVTFNGALGTPSSGVGTNLTGIPTTALLTGAQVQQVNTITGAVSTGSTTIPIDDTIPQITEGNEYMTLAITPKNASNKLKIDVVCNLSSSSTTQFLIAALFQDSTANALAAGTVFENTATGGIQIVFTHYMTAGTTSSTTFRVRAGAQAGTTTFNGSGGSRELGGVLVSSITITEIAV